MLGWSVGTGLEICWALTGFCGGNGRGDDSDGGCRVGEEVWGGVRGVSQECAGSAAQTGWLEKVGVYSGWSADSQVAARENDGRDLPGCLRALLVDEYELFRYRNAFGALISSCRSGMGTTPAAPLNRETLLPELLRTYI
jgi:hypothetical protein